MSIEREVVEAYFESNGFLVRQAGDSISSGGKKKLSGLPTLAIFNPMTSANADDLSFRIFTGDLSSVRSALVSFIGWESSSFSFDCLDSDARLIKFFKAESILERLPIGFQPSESLIESGMGNFLRLLVVPSFPRNEAKAKVLSESLKSVGVDGFLTLRSVIENLLRQTMPASTFLNQDVFHLLRLLKAYDLVKEPQLDMFEN